MLLPSRSNPKVQRVDIQALRGFAVIIVVFFHAKLPLFAGGFLGVDVFFVISGYLITRLIAGGIRDGSFSISSFYHRRAQRLLPAAYVTFLVSAIAAPFLLNDPELHDFRGQLLGALAFCANIVLWRQSGYFDGEADLKPLLHTWSLSVEEQYYFLLPVILTFTPRRHWFRLLLGVTSLGFAAFAYRQGNSSTFYLLPTRAWELGIGSLGALLATNELSHRVLRLAFWPACVALTLAPFIPTSSYVSLITVATCTATLIIILREYPILDSNVFMSGLAWLGDRSYSLYLVHWPLFAFLNNSWFSHTASLPPLLLRLLLVGLSVLLAAVLFWSVERPVHLMSLKTQGIALRLAVMGSLLIGATAFAAPLLNQPTRDYTYILRRNFGYSHNCEFTTEFRAIPACRNSSKAETMVWGDSYAMHLIPGMTADRANATVIQATRSTCAPVLDIAFTDMSAYNQEWAEECIRFNDSVLKYLSKAPSVSVVVLGSIYRQLVKSGNFVVVRRDDGKLLRIDATVKEATTRLLGTIRAIRAMGKRVVVVSPPPYASYDVGRCLERIERGLPVIGVSTRCYIMLTNSDAELQGVAALMDALADTGEIGILDLPSILCESGRCRTAADGVFLYRDKGHFSVEGSIHLFRSYGLASKVNMLAR